jgi:hypothetical protein
MKWKGGKRRRSRSLILSYAYYLNIFLEELRRTTKNLSEDSLSPGRDLNAGPPEYKAGVLSTRQRRSVSFILDAKGQQTQGPCNIRCFKDEGF